MENKPRTPKKKVKGSKIEFRNIQVISLETTTKKSETDVQNSFKNKNKKGKNKNISVHKDGKRSVGLKNSLLKRRINKKVMSAKTSMKKLILKKKRGKMSVKSFSKRKNHHLKQLEMKLNRKNVRGRGKGYITPCKPSMKNIHLEIDVDAGDENNQLSNMLSRSRSRVMSKFKSTGKKRIVKSIRKSKKKLVDPNGFKLRAEARCQERKRLKEVREMKRKEKQLKEL